MDLSLYEKRIGAVSLSEAHIEHSIIITNHEFSQATGYIKIKINDIEEDCILSNTKKSTVKELLLRPRKIATKGLYVTISNERYLCTEFVPNEVYPKMTIELCNNILKWEDENGDLVSYECVIKGNQYDEDDGKSIIIIDSSEMTILIGYDNVTKKIKPQQRFIVGDSAFTVSAIDKISNVYKDNGFIKLTIKATSLSSTDDIDNGVPNESGNSDWGGW